MTCALTFCTQGQVKTISEESWSQRNGPCSFFCSHYVLVSVFLVQKCMGTAPQAGIHKLCERPPLSSWGVFWIDPDVYSSVLDSLSTRPNGSALASASPQSSFRQASIWLVGSQSKARWSRTPQQQREGLSLQCYCSLMSSAACTTAEGSGEVSRWKES